MIEVCLQAHEVDAHFSMAPQNVGLVFGHLFMTRATLKSHCLAPISRFHARWMEHIRIPESYIITLEIIFFTLGTYILGVPDPQNVCVIRMLHCNCTRFDF